MPRFKVIANYGLSIKGDSFFNGDTFECEKSLMTKYLERGVVKELIEPKKTKELKGSVKTK